MHLVPHSFIRLPIHSFGQFLLPRYLMNGLSSIDETYREYPLATTYDLIRFWRSKVMFTAGCRGSKGIHVDSSLKVYL